MTQLVRYEQARNAVAECHRIDDAKDIADKALALQAYARQARDPDMERWVAEIRLRARRRVGELSAALETAPSGRAALSCSEPGTSKIEALEAAGLSRTEAHRCEQIAKVPPERFEAYIATQTAAGKVVTADEVVAKTQNPHVTNNSGENEWYTPPRIIEAARRVMGGIDTDPASSDFANKTVKAKRYFTAETNGLMQKWAGRVWMNPPYAQPLISEFIEAAVTKFEADEFDEACVLVNNATETQWFQRLLGPASAVCFVKGRIKYLDSTGTPANTPLQGQAVVYLGKRPKSFAAAFADDGSVLFHHG